MGSVKVEIADLGSDTWYDMGPGEGAAFTEEFKTDEYFPDNAATYGAVLLDQINTIDFMAVEPDFPLLQKARGNIDTITPIEGTLVSGHTQAFNSGQWAFEQFLPFDLQNVNGAAPTMDLTHPCLAGTDGDLTEGTDFHIVKAGGIWGAIVHDTVAVTTAAQLLTFKYSATPAAAYELSTGGASEIGFIKLRLTNTSAAGKVFRVEFYRVQCVKGFALKFESNRTTAKPNLWVLQFKAFLDETRTVKDQLHKMYFEV